MSRIQKIQERCEELGSKKKERQDQNEKNRAAAIELVKFITNVVNSVAYGQIRAVWYGSYTNPGVADYPCVTIHAVLSSPDRLLAKWRINADGSVPPPEITEGDILSKLEEALSQI